MPSARLCVCHAPTAPRAFQSPLLLASFLSVCLFWALCWSRLPSSLPPSRFLSLPLVLWLHRWNPRSGERRLLRLPSKFAGAFCLLLYYYYLRAGGFRCLGSKWESPSDVFVFGNWFLRAGMSARRSLGFLRSCPASFFFFFFFHVGSGPA